MNAKEMFEELGFEYKKYRTGFAYEYEVERGIKFVHFDLSMHKYCTNIYHVEKKLHNAITMQMKELGWLDVEYGAKFKHCTNCGQAIDWSDEDVE